MDEKASSLIRNNAERLFEVFGQSRAVADASEDVVAQKKDTDGGAVEKGCGDVTCEMIVAGVEHLKTTDFAATSHAAATAVVVCPRRWY